MSEDIDYVEAIHRAMLVSDFRQKGQSSGTLSPMSALIHSKCDGIEYITKTESEWMGACKCGWGGLIEIPKAQQLAYEIQLKAGKIKLEPTYESTFRRAVFV